MDKIAQPYSHMDKIAQPYSHMDKIAQPYSHMDKRLKQGAMANGQRLTAHG